MQNKKLDLSDFILNTSEFTLKSEIGKGGYGSVYIAEEISTKKVYAAKILQKLDASKNEKKYFRELEILLKSHHPAILRFLGFSLSGFASFPQHPVLFTEYLSNKSLLDRISNSQDQKTLLLTNTQKQIIIYGIAKGMEYLHKNMIFHRDLKSGNVLLDDKLYPKICDFGLSKITTSLSNRQQSLVCGTPIYMAPEVFTGKYDFHSDTYAYGIILYEVLTNTIADEYSQSSEKDSLPVFRPNFESDFPQNFISLIQQCLRSPEKRPDFRSISQTLLETRLSDIDDDEYQKYVNLMRDSDDSTPLSQLSSYPSSPCSSANNNNNNNNSFSSSDNYYSQAMSYIEGPNKNQIKAAECMRKAAYLGNNDAQYLYANMLKDGNGVVQNMEESVELFRKAADDNHRDSQFELAKILFNDGNQPEAAKYFRLAADNGHRRARYLFADILEHGMGIIDMKNESIKYLKQAADDGESEAQYDYAVKMEKSNQNDIAEKYFKMAAENGDPNAQFKYGMILFNKKEKKTVNQASAAVLFKESADKENGDGENAYGICLRDGRGVKKCIKEANEYFKRAASHNCVEGIYNYGLALERGKRKEDAIEQFKIAANKNFPLAQEHYAELIYNDSVTEAAQYYKMAADAGLPRAQYEFANMLIDGVGVIQSTKKANKYLEMAAVQNHQDAQFLYAYMLEKNHRIKDSAKYYKMAADSGSVKAMEKYALLLLNGKGKMKNLEEATKYFEKAAEKGNILCKIQLAKMTKDYDSLRKLAETNDDAKYEMALITKNDDEAVKLLLEVDPKKHAEAAVQLAEMFKYGLRGIKKNMREAVKYYSMAADLGNPIGLTNVAIFCMSGVLMKKDTEKATGYFKQAAELNDPIAQLNYGLILLNIKRNPKEAVGYFKRAADQKNANAQYYYAMQLLHGEGIPADAEQAEYYLKQSAENNYPNAQFQYALFLLEKGQKLNEAAKNMECAANKDISQAQFEYGKMLEKGIGVNANEEMAIKFFERAAKLQNENAIQYLNHKKGISKCCTTFGHSSTSKHLPK